MINGTSALIRTVPTFQATALLGKGVEFVKKKKKAPANFVKTFATIIVGIPLIRATAKQISLV